MKVTTTLLELDTAVYIDQVSITSTDRPLTEMPQDFKVFGSHDNLVWSELLSQSETGWVTQVPIVYTVDSTRKWKWLALVVTTTNGATRLHIGDMKYRTKSELFEISNKLDTLISYMEMQNKILNNTHAILKLSLVGAGVLFEMAGDYTGGGAGFTTSSPAVNTLFHMTEIRLMILHDAVFKASDFGGINGGITNGFSITVEGGSQPNSVCTNNAELLLAFGDKINTLDDNCIVFIKRFSQPQVYVTGINPVSVFLNDDFTDLISMRCEIHGFVTVV